ncbi:MAG: hypothetical protein FWF85_09195, partial [Clostridiales bacterium]|nr:hypothetical protein [Clostridiales bacterium]
IYVLADYYNKDGRFSDPALALDENDFARILAVNGGDILIAGSRQYQVTAESLTLSFYPQPSLDQVIRWWTDCLDSWAASGKVTALD